MIYTSQTCLVTMCLSGSSAFMSDTDLIIEKARYLMVCHEILFCVSSDFWSNYSVFTRNTILLLCVYLPRHWFHRMFNWIRLQCLHMAPSQVTRFHSSFQHTVSSHHQKREEGAREKANDAVIASAASQHAAITMLIYLGAVRYRARIIPKWRKAFYIVLLISEGGISFMAKLQFVYIFSICMVALTLLCSFARCMILYDRTCCGSSVFFSVDVILER